MFLPRSATRRITVPGSACRRVWRLPAWARLWAFAAGALFLSTMGAAAPSAPSTPSTAAGSRDVAAREAPLRVLAAGDLRGEIKPCGCSPEGQMGGLPRRLAYLERNLTGAVRAPILLDLGNNFPPPSPQGRLKIDLIETLLARFPPDAILPGPNELALGVAGLGGALPYVLSNEAGSGQGSTDGTFPHTRTVERGGRRIGLYGYLSPAAVYQGTQSRFRLLPADGALMQRLRRSIARSIAREGQQAAILLFRGDDAELAEFLRAGLFALIVAGNPSADEMNQITERTVAGRRVAQVPTKGQGVLRLALEVDGAAVDGAATDGAVAAGGGMNGAPQVDWLKDGWADHPDAGPVFQAYDEAVKKLFFARLDTMDRHGRKSPFSGAAACRTCHPDAARIWDGSRHARALATLERVGKQFDPECLACHVVGFERGGFLSQELTPALANVQCENCHGPGKAHAANPAVRTVPSRGVPSGIAAGPAARTRNRNRTPPDESVCRTCHQGSHSPSFSFAAYWPKVRHP